MSQTSNTLRQEVDSIGRYEDHIQEILFKLGIDFNVQDLSIETPEQALEAIKNIKSMLIMLEKKKSITEAARFSYTLVTNSDKEPINRSLF